MSAELHWFVVVGTLISLVAFGWLLIANRGRADGGAHTTGHAWDDDLEELDTPLPGWWVAFFVATIVIAVGYLIAYPGLGNARGLLGWTSAGEHDADVVHRSERYGGLRGELATLTDTDLAGDVRARRLGQRLFLNHCATCHGVDGLGAPGFPDLTDRSWTWGGGVDAIQKSVAEGREGRMPPWVDALGGADGVREVTEYVVALSGRDHDDALAARGSVHFAKVCVACHGADGSGNQSLGAPDLTDDAWQYGSSRGAIALAVQYGRSGVMPAHSHILRDVEIRLVAAYVASLGDEQSGDEPGAAGAGGL